MKLGLLQLNDSNEIYLVDCLLIKEPYEGCTFLTSNKVTKIFHSCREDLEALHSWSKSKVSNIYDTQLANSLLGGAFSISYQGLVENKLGLNINKKETRTNWLKRPLSEAQLNYAASDVYYLIDLYELQLQEFLKTNKLEWLIEELNFTSTEPSMKEVNRQKLISIEKTKEKEILHEINGIVKEISQKEDINPTLFFSKQSQKKLLNSTMTLGIEESLDNITKWRRGLIEDSFLKILNSHEVF